MDGNGAARPARTFGWEHGAEVLPKPYCLADVFLFSQWRFQGNGKAKTRAASFANLQSQAASGRWKAFKSVVTWRITNTTERANHRPPVLWRSLKNYSASTRREQTALCLNFHPAPAIHPAHCERERERNDERSSFQAANDRTLLLLSLHPQTLRSIYHLVGDAPSLTPHKKKKNLFTKNSGINWHWASLTLGSWGQVEFACWNTGEDCAGGNGSKNPRITAKISLHISLAFFSSELIPVVPSSLMRSWKTWRSASWLKTWRPSHLETMPRVIPVWPLVQSRLVKWHMVCPRYSKQLPHKHHSCWSGWKRNSKFLNP